MSYKNTFCMCKGFTYFATDDIAFAKFSPCFKNKKSVFLLNLKMDMEQEQQNCMYFGDIQTIY